MAGDDRWQAGEASGSCARSWCLPELGCSTSAWASPRCVPRICSSQPETRPRGAQTRRRLRPTTLRAFCRGRSRQSCTLISPLGEDSNRIHRQYGVWVQVRITKRDGEYFTLARRLDSAGGGTDAWTADGQTDEHDNLGRTAAVSPLLDPD